MDSAILNWTTACPDWEERIVKGRSLIPCKPLYQDVADVALKAFNALKVVDVMDSPEMGGIVRDWVTEFVAVIFGAYNTSTRRRLINEYFLLIPKKNTKSTIAAFIMLTAFILNSRRSAELIILAPTKEVAENSFNPIRDAIEADPELNEMMNISAHTKTITHIGTNAILKVVAADDKSTGGKKASWVLVDELHLFQTMSDAASMFREATGGLASRTEGCLLWLSTQSKEPPCGVFKSKLDYARDVRDGKIIDKKFLPLIYEFPQSMIDSEEYKDPENFHIPNPNYGASVDIEQLNDDYNKSKYAGEDDVKDFFAKRLNVQIGMNLRANRWAGADFWEEKERAFDLEYLIGNSECITIGFDGGGLDDLFSMYVIGRDKHYRSLWRGWSRSWLHPIAMDRRKSSKQLMEDFARKGDLVIVETIGEDVSQAGEIAKRIFDTGKMPEQGFGLDQLGMPSLLDGLLAAGIPQESMVAVPQGYKLSGYATTAERKLADGTFIPAEQGLVKWAVSNAKGKMSGNALMITKQESGKGKIDPVIAMFNAIALMSVNPEAAAQSLGVYFV
ncbi:terminase large subunit [Acinetobacter chinensis]|uniref:Terminase large subunit n=1 Tax=Acinetobacter chinensis TaxID=2004650 RepID=A0A3B7LWM1_9GAMM|nr:terminase large subunit [Acinetobacter chinensis]AXY57280.1 terminase large subunit [Acinetobacter chinensis]